MGDMNVTIPVLANGDYPRCHVPDCGGLTRKCTLVRSNEDKMWRYSRQTGDPPVHESIDLYCNYRGPMGWEWIVKYYYDKRGDGINFCHCEWQVGPTTQNLSGGGSAAFVPEQSFAGPSTGAASWAPAP